MAEIIPAVMAKSWGELKEKVTRVAHYVPAVQLDIMDGKFVRSRSWPYFSNDYSFDELITESEGLPFWDELDYEIDLMVQNPEDILNDWILAGAMRLIVHIESTKKMDEIVKEFQTRFSFNPETNKRDVELVLAINVDTPTDDLLPYLEDIDGIQFMGIALIGYQGQPFDEKVINKIHDFHIAHPEVIISVDGGVNPETAPMLIEAGATRLVAGSAIFESSNPQETINILKEMKPYINVN